MVTNAELDHHETYGSLRDVLETFARVRRRPSDAVVPPALTERLGGVATTTAASSVRSWRCPGEHNRLNAGAALAALELAGVDGRRRASSLTSFEGAGRRFERLGETDAGAVVVDDYAHHPTEVAATIAAARTLAPRRVVALFQPHLFSRTRAEARGFGAALAAADVAVVTGIYPARERQEDFPGVTGLRVAEAAADAGGARRLDADARRRRAPTSRAVLRPGDLCLTLGAGDVDSVGARARGRAEPRRGVERRRQWSASPRSRVPARAASAVASLAAAVASHGPGRRAGCGCATRRS